LPKDIQLAEVEFDTVATSTFRVPVEYFDRRLVIDAAEELVQAKRPAMLVGSGAVSSGACEDLKELAEMLSLPVATTPKAKGAFPEDHPLALGVLGLCGSPLAENYLRSGQTDVLLVVGASLNQMTTLSWDPQLAPTKCLIHANIDPTEIGKNYSTQIALVGDARTIVNEIAFRVMRHLANRQTQWEDRLQAVAELRAKVGTCLEPAKLDSDSVPLKPQRLVRELQDVLPEDAILFVDVGNAVNWVGHYMKFRRPGSVITPFGMLTMGYGVSAAVGGKLAAGARPVIALLGDGCFLMNGMEIATAAHNDIPVVFIVLNNQKLGLVHDLQTFSLGEHTVATRFPKINAAKVAEGLGAVGHTVEKPGELQRLLPAAVASGKTTVIDCVIDPSEVPPLSPFVEGAKRFLQHLA
jgi:acetolactate synthase-1/2/3 large subunit